jgi:hypothetical protein
MSRVLVLEGGVDGVYAPSVQTSSKRKRTGDLSTHRGASELLDAVACLVKTLLRWYSYGRQLGVRGTGHHDPAGGSGWA